MTEDSKPPKKQPDIRLQLVKLVLGFAAGVVLLLPFAFHVLLRLNLSDAVQMMLIGASISSFGLAAHGAYKVTPGGGA